MKLFLIGVVLLPIGAFLTIFTSPKSKGYVFSIAALIAQFFLLTPAILVLAGGESLSLLFQLSDPIGTVRLVLDPLAAFFVLIISCGGLLAAIYSVGYMKMYENSRYSLSVYYIFMGLLISAMLLVVTTQNALFFLVMWEIMSIASFFLVSFENGKEEVRKAALYYLIAMQIGAAFLIAAFAWMVTRSGSMDFVTFRQVFQTSGSYWIFLLFLIGFGTKAGLVPMHSWLPRAHPAAPTGVSALMSGVMIKTGIYGILRLLLLWGTPDVAASYTVLGIALVSGIFGVMNAIAQHDLKKLLAYHSIENIGIIGIGIGIGMLGLAYHQNTIALLGFLGGLLHVFNHFTFKSLLFYGAGIIYSKTHTRQIEKMGGLMHYLPVTAVLFLVGSLAISGLPLFSGFISEFAIYLGMIRGYGVTNLSLNVASLVSLAGLAFIGIMAVLCFTKVFGICFLGTPRTAYPENIRDDQPAMLFPMILLAGVILIIGLAAGLVVPLMSRIVSQFVPGHTVAEWTEIRLIFSQISGVLAIFVVLIFGFLGLRRILLRNKPVAVFKTWDCGYQAEIPRAQYTGSSFASPFTGLISGIIPKHKELDSPKTLFPSKASYASHSEDLIELYLITPMIRFVRGFLKLFNWIQSGRTQQYILYGLVFLVVLLIWIIGMR